MYTAIGLGAILISGLGVVFGVCLTVLGCNFLNQHCLYNHSYLGCKSSAPTEQYLEGLQYSSRGNSALNMINIPKISSTQLAKEILKPTYIKPSCMTIFK